VAILQDVAEFHLETLNASSDFARPLGEWEAIGVAIGDASGQTVTMRAVLARQYLWSFEAWSGSTSIASTGDVHCTWNPNLTPGGVAWVLGSPVLVSSNLRMNRASEGRLLLPVSGRIQGTLGGVIAQVVWEVNVLTAVYRCNMWGYYWDKRALLGPGGLVRP